MNLWERDSGFEFGDEKYEERWEVDFGLDNEMEEEEENKDGWWVGEKEVESITEAAIFGSLGLWTWVSSTLFSQLQVTTHKRRFDIFLLK